MMFKEEMLMLRQLDQESFKKYVGEFIADKMITTIQDNGHGKYIDIDDSIYYCIRD